MRSRKNVLEEGSEEMLDFYKLVNYFKFEQEGRNKYIMPVVVQDAVTKEVLMLAYANKAAIEYSLKNRVAAFWSTSCDGLWVKGLTSGSVLGLVEIRVNCGQNSLLYLVEPLDNAGACHTKKKGVHRKSCYYRRLLFSKGKKVLKKLKKEIS